MTIQKYLKTHKMKRKQFLKLCDAEGWKVHKSTLSCWISGKRKPPSSAIFFLRSISNGEITA